MEEFIFPFGDINGDLPNVIEFFVKHGFAEQEGQGHDSQSDWYSGVDGPLEKIQVDSFDLYVGEETDE